MAIYRVLQDHVVSESEARSLPPLVGAGAATAPLSGGRTLDLTLMAAVAASAPAFTPVGPGQPLTVMIRHVYTGRFPRKSVLGSHSDVAVVSGVKDFDVFSPSSRALNIIRQGQTSHNHLVAADAWSQGTQVVLYLPAVIADSITVSLELATANFAQPLLDLVSGALGQLGGVPLLMPYQGYLMAGAQVTKLAGNIGHALFDGPAFSVTDTLNFDLPGASVAAADFRVMCGPGLPADQFSYREGQGLVDAQGKVYAGDEPYFVISLDGRANDRLNAFAPTVASSGVLQRFFEMKDGAQASADALLQGLQLVSDMTYRTQADTLAARIAQTPEGPDKDALVARRTALLKNIQTDALRPAN